MLIDSVVHHAEALLREDNDVVSRLVASRKRCENWLQIELVKRLIRGNGEVEAELEKPYPDGRERCDLWRREEADRESWVELKICVTNYANYFTGPSSARPITNQISDVLRDAEKLQRISGERANRHVFMLAYPLPLEHHSNENWANHLGKIQAASRGIAEAFAIAVKRSDKTASVVAYTIAI